MKRSVQTQFESGVESGQGSSVPEYATPDYVQAHDALLIGVAWAFLIAVSASSLVAAVVVRRVVRLKSLVIV